MLSPDESVGTEEETLCCKESARSVPNEAVYLDMFRLNFSLPDTDSDS